MIKRLKRWLTLWLTGYDVDALLADIKRGVDAQRDCVQAWKDAAEATKECEVLRALLAQLRVDEMNHAGLKGYGVTIFIPQAVLKRLRENAANQKLFEEKVSRQLTRRALLGLFTIKPHQHEPAALAWMPLGPKSKTREILAFTEKDVLNKPVMFDDQMRRLT